MFTFWVCREERGADFNMDVCMAQVINTCLYVHNAVRYLYTPTIYHRQLAMGCAMICQLRLISLAMCVPVGPIPNKRHT